MEKNLGHATAYGYAKSKGYSGTEDEFAELMADYASVGQSAAQSAEQAAASATSASGSAATATQAAQTATSKASEAVTAAGTATTKASEASQSASTASAAASFAGTSAQTATTAATTATAKASEASESATTATTAKTDAETARDAAAQSASEAAESARTLTIDATLTQSGQAADAKAVGDLTNQLIHNLEYNSAGGGKTLPYKFINDYSYTVTNGTSANMSCKTADISGNDVQVISAGIASGSSYTFTANADAPNFKFYSGGSGTVAVICNSTRIPVLEQNVTTLQTELQTTNTELSTFKGSVVQRVDIIKSTGGTDFAFKFEAGKRYIVYNGTNATMSCKTADSSNTNIETITGGMVSNDYIMFNATQNAERFKCYSGASGKVSVWCVDTITGTADYNIETMSTWHGNVHSVNHRGFNFVAPENTIPAFILSRKNGFNTVESDVQFTSDGVAVMLHDKTINRTARNADGTEISSTINISDITYEQALTYDFGIWKGNEYAGTKIPTLDEFLVICKRLGLEIYIELKVPITQAQVNTIVEKVEKNGMRGKVSYICFSDQPLAYARDADNYARLGVLSGGIDSGQIELCEALRTGKNEVFIDSSTYTSAEIALCISAHVPLEIWTIDNPSTILNADPYISGFSSNSLIAGQTLLQRTLIS